MKIPLNSLSLLLFAAMVVLPASAVAAEETPPKPCAAPEHRQFDFWVGTWTVRDPQGTIVGTNRIEKILGSCGLQENWSSPAGTKGTSLNLYDAVSKQWHQTWIDSGGMLLQLDGNLRDGKMILEGKQPSQRKPGTVVHSRVTWTPIKNGTVNQLWEMRPQDEAEWKTVFEGIYTRQPAGD